MFASPGNPGIGKCAQLVSLDPGDHAAIAQFCGQQSVDLVVIGPEAPLVAGLADHLREAGIAVFGPSAKAAQLEGSKGFTKDLCARVGIPTAGYVRANTLGEARAALTGFRPPYVLKADGLAAGKGVIIAESIEAAEIALADMFDGPAGAAVVIEEFLEGEEASFFALSDGETILPFGSAQDHKRVGEGDEGPNTGGMGAYSPARVLTPALEAQVMREIIEPTIAAMREEGAPYSGVLYAGLMLTREGPRLIEYNCRFGDPECQVLMMRLESDLAHIMHACAAGALAGVEARFADDAALTVVMAARGYPGTPEKGGAIDLGPFAQGDEAHGDEAHGARVFQAGTAMQQGALVANGGRVLNITARGANVSEAQASAYAAIGRIGFETGFYRRDIGWREIAREKEA